MSDAFHFPRTLNLCDVSINDESREFRRFRHTRLKSIATVADVCRKWSEKFESEYRVAWDRDRATCLSRCCLNVGVVRGARCVVACGRVVNATVAIGVVDPAALQTCRQIRIKLRAFV